MYLFFFFFLPLLPLFPRHSYITTLGLVVSQTA